MKMSAALVTSFVHRWGGIDAVATMREKRRRRAFTETDAEIC